MHALHIAHHGISRNGNVIAHCQNYIIAYQQGAIIHYIARPGVYTGMDKGISSIACILYTVYGKCFLPKGSKG
jgi:hypothetical protein